MGQLTAFESYLSQQEYLRSAADYKLHELPLYCGVCSGFGGYPECLECERQRLEAQHNGWKLADHIGCVVYGDYGGGDEAGWAVDSYRDSADPEVRRLLETLLEHTFYHYWDDLVALGGPVSAVTLVPRADGQTQLWRFVENALQTVDNPPPLLELLHDNAPGAGTQPTRLVRPERYGCRTDGGHVLLVHDCWVTGRSIQSAAAQLHLAGAQYVTVLALVRLLERDTTPAAPAFTPGRWGQSPFQ